MLAGAPYNGWLDRDNRALSFQGKRLSHPLSPHPPGTPAPRPGKYIECKWACPEGGEAHNRVRRCGDNETRAGHYGSLQGLQAVLLLPQPLATFQVPMTVFTCNQTPRVYFITGTVRLVFYSQWSSIQEAPFFLQPSLFLIIGFFVLTDGKCYLLFFPSGVYKLSASILLSFCYWPLLLCA